MRALQDAPHDLLRNRLPRAGSMPQLAKQARAQVDRMCVVLYMSEHVFHLSSGAECKRQPGTDPLPQGMDPEYGNDHSEACYRAQRRLHQRPGEGAEDIEREPCERQADAASQQ